MKQIDGWEKKTGNNHQLNFLRQVFTQLLLALILLHSWGWPWTSASSQFPSQALKFQTFTCLVLQWALGSKSGLCAPWASTLIYWATSSALKVIFHIKYTEVSHCSPGQGNHILRSMTFNYILTIGIKTCLTIGIKTFVKMKQGESILEKLPIVYLFVWVFSLFFIFNFFCGLRILHMHMFWTNSRHSSLPSESSPIHL